jgi:hypothetical protein
MIGNALDRFGFRLSVVEAGSGPALAGASDPAAAKMSIGASRYGSYQEFAHATYQTYQAAVDDGYAAAQEALDNGTVTVPPGVSRQTVLGQQTDAFARDAMKLWVESEGVAEGTGAPNIIQINRRLLDPSFSGVYRVPDVYVPPAGQIFDASLEFKIATSPQIRDFWNYSNGSRITIVRPTEAGGSYSILPPW